MEAILNYQRWQPFKIENLMSKAYFEVFKVFYSLLGEKNLVTLGYQLLPLTTSQLVGNDKEFDISSMF